MATQLAMKGITLLLLFILPLSVMAQVGFGTETVSPSAMLEIGSFNSKTETYAGIMPPRVDSELQRNLINPKIEDRGLLIFVRNTGTLEMWNGSEWINVHELNPTITEIARQDFEGGTANWSYGNSPGFYDVPAQNHLWQIVNTIPNAPEIDNVSGFFLGCKDLDDPSDPGILDHSITFETMDVSTVANPRISFDYDIVGYDSGDNVTYEIIVDGVSRGISNLLIGTPSPISKEGKEIIIIPNKSTSVIFKLIIVQDGEDGFAGFDNFKIYGQ